MRNFEKKLADELGPDFDVEVFKTFTFSDGDPADDPGYCLQFSWQNDKGEDYGLMLRIGSYTVDNCDIFQIRSLAAHANYYRGQSNA